jgi:O-antigen/teichoic acid export membrane protein
MSLARSVAATAASRAYLALLGLLVLPVYLQRLGAEAYGLVALFFALQAWLQLLDMGFPTTLARESSRFRVGAVAGLDLRMLLRAVERLSLLVVLTVGAALFLISGPVARDWLNLHALDLAQAQRAIEWMVLAVMLRLLSDVYRGVLTGFEQLGWLAGCNALFGSVRLLGVLPFLAWVGATPAAFLAFQAGVGLLELAVLAARAHRLVPTPAQRLARWDMQPLRRVFGFSMSMSVAAAVWVLASQFDKLVLSGVLTLADYGHFGMVTAAATALLLLTGSIAEVAVPRLTALSAAGSADLLLDLYRRTSQWTAVVACSAGAWMGFHANDLLRVWVADTALAERMGPVLALYALGNAAMGMAALPYYLQLAQGRLGLHLVATGCMVAVQVPSIVWAASHHGAVGAAVSWLIVNALYLLVWPAVVHRRVSTPLHRLWLLRDVLPPACAAAVAGMVSSLLPWPEGRWAGLCVLLASGCGILLCAAAAAPRVRADVRNGLRSRA